MTLSKILWMRRFYRWARDRNAFTFSAILECDPYDEGNMIFRNVEDYSLIDNGAPIQKYLILNFVHTTAYY
jgi:hypothetical protein